MNLILTFSIQLSFIKLKMTKLTKHKKSNIKTNWIFGITTITIFSITKYEIFKHIKLKHFATSSDWQGPIIKACKIMLLVKVWNFLIKYELFILYCFLRSIVFGCGDQRPVLFNYCILFLSIFSTRSSVDGFLFHYRW